MTTNRAATSSRWNGERPSEYRATAAPSVAGKSGAARSTAPSSLRARSTFPARPAATGGAASSGAGAATLSSWASRSSRTSTSLSRDTSSRTASRVSGSGSAGAALSPAPGGPAATAASGRSTSNPIRSPSRLQGRAWFIGVLRDGGSRTARRSPVAPESGPSAIRRGHPTAIAPAAPEGRLVGRPAGAGLAGRGPEQAVDARAVRLIEGREHGPDQRAGQPGPIRGPASGDPHVAPVGRRRRLRNRRSACRSRGLAGSASLATNSTVARPMRVTRTGWRVSSMRFPSPTTSATAGRSTSARPP